MGGRYYYNRKATADESYGLRIYKLKRLGMLSKGESFNKITWTNSRTGKETSIIVAVYLTDDPFVLLMYSITDRDGNKTDYHSEVSLITTPCYYGGVRWWFACPVCGLRVGILYRVPGGTRFYCRHCNNLTYWSRNRCTVASFGHTSREIERLQKEIKRWTWRGRPTRKVRRLRALQWKMRGLGMVVEQRMDRMFGRLR